MAEASAPRTISAAITSVARELTTAGITHAGREAELLVAAVSGRSQEDLLVHPEAPLADDQERFLRSLASRRAAREPLAYLLGRTEFYSVSFQITPAAMVPRPETEILVEAAIARAPETGLAVDVGTGCGAIAISLALQIPGLRVVGTDISRKALALAKRNCDLHHLGDRVGLVAGDLLAAIGRPADLIVANLPYVGTDEFPALAPEVRDFEPRIALDGGEDGLRVIRRLSVELWDHLCPGGFAALEVGAGQATEVAKLLALAGLSQITVLPDYAGIDRVVIGWREG